MENVIKNNEYKRQTGRNISADTVAITADGMYLMYDGILYKKFGEMPKEK